MKQEIFRGIATALATPMELDGAIDYEAYGRLIDWQIDAGVAGLVACGTTGCRLPCAFHRAGHIAGTGSNCTAKAVAMTQYACSVGADACLLVTPYYNKATQAGLIAHYTAIADASDKPLILYNVPSRTGCNLLPATCAALADHPRIAAVKEASGNIGQIVEVAALAGDRLAIYSGNDDHIVPVLSMGGSGCISVLSNVVPREAQALCRRFFAGDVAGAAALQCKLLPLVNALFSEVNPIPVNAALAAMGFGKGGVRLPLTPMEESRRAALLAEMKRLGVLA